MTTVPSVKRAFADALIALSAQDAGALAGVQCAYAWPGRNQARNECVYLGGWRSTTAVDAVDGRKKIYLEDAHFTLQIRVMKDLHGRFDSTREAEQRCEDIADAIGNLISQSAKDAPWHDLEFEASLGEARNDEQTVTAYLAYTMRYQARFVADV